VRNLPAVFAGGAFHPPVTPVHAVSNPQDGPEQSRIGRIAVLALARVAEGGRVVGVEPNTIVGEGRIEILGPAHAASLPVPRLDLRPLDLDGGIGPLLKGHRA
jgi:hypothetical protein